MSVYCTARITVRIFKYMMWEAWVAWEAWVPKSTVPSRLGRSSQKIQGTLKQIRQEAERQFPRTQSPIEQGRRGRNRSGGPSIRVKHPTPFLAPFDELVDLRVRFLAQTGSGHHSLGFRR